MQVTTTILYFTDPETGLPHSNLFTSEKLEVILLRTEELRKGGMSHVCMSVENVNSVGKPGVDSVEDGKTPDGMDYTWKKRRV